MFGTVHRTLVGFGTRGLLVRRARQAARLIGSSVTTKPGQRLGHRVHTLAHWHPVKAFQEGSMEMLHGAPHVASVRFEVETKSSLSRLSYV